MKNLTTLSFSLLVASSALANTKRHAPAFERALDAAMVKREPQGPGGGIIPTFGESESESSSTSTSSSRSPDPPSSTPTSTSTSSTRPPEQPPTSESSTSSSTTTTSSTPSSSTSSSRSTQPVVNNDTRTTPRSTQSVATVRQATTITTRTNSSPTTSETEASTGSSFTNNKGAVAATVTVAAIVVIGALVFIAFWIKKHRNRGKMAEEDMWDEASMKDFSRPPVAGMPMSPPPVAAMSLADNDNHVTGLTRTRTQVQTLPSQQLALSRQRSAHSSPGRSAERDMEPDEILSMPPVVNYERPRDSAYDIVPAAPPMAAYASQQQQGYGYDAQGYGQDYTAYSNAYASASGSNAYASSSNAGFGANAASGSGSNGGLAPPKRAGDHTSFGSGFGNDPFAGTGFVDATRENAYASGSGSGQAGRGVGYGSASGSGSNAAVGMGNQWPQNYDPYTGYSQGSHSQTPYGQSQQAYGGGYGYAN